MKELKCSVCRKVIENGLGMSACYDHGNFHYCDDECYSNDAEEQSFNGSLLMTCEPAGSALLY